MTLPTESCGSRNECGWTSCLDCPRRGLRPVGTEQAIPPRQVEAEIAVRFPPIYRVMDTMHIWRHQDEAKQPSSGSRMLP